MFGNTIGTFHHACHETQHSHPYTMLATSTHDTKRSEDVRARISLLSEIPERWRDAVTRWAGMNDKHRRNGCPDRKTEYFLYQTMLGAWPIGIERLWPYMEKACREAKEQTNWLSPNESFERATREFIEGVCADSEFLRDFEAFVQPLIGPGRVNSLAQVLLKLTSPGIPDIYQGTELWDLSLVDPDNRRPVDYELRRRLLSEVPNLKVGDVLARCDEGLPKLWTIWHALRVRHCRASSFGRDGAYAGIRADGEKAAHIVAFTRGTDVLVAVPRLPIKLGGNWEDTAIPVPPGKWTNVLSGAHAEGGAILVRDLFASFPATLLVRQ
ncbi:MAG: hypothetical protein JO061_12025 [Acidobacteriaceae bacterium]|nr:hypothetical protein [Acidobacteriaceae bacterium]